jgi:hypothetical protein
LAPGFPIPPWKKETEDVTLPLMLALERLSPLERAAFLLHDIFELELRRSRQPSIAIRRSAANSPPARADVREANLVLRSTSNGAPRAR